MMTAQQSHHCKKFDSLELFSAGNKSRLALHNALLDHDCLHRDKREEFCQGCSRSAAQTDRVYLQIYDLPACQGKNVMVCKSCTVERAENVTLHAVEPPFEVWCLDKGKSLQTSMHMSRYLQPIAGRLQAMFRTWDKIEPVNASCHWQDYPTTREV